MGGHSTQMMAMCCFSDNYGKIYAVMRRPIADAYKTQESIPQRLPTTVDRRLWNNIVARIKKFNKLRFGGKTAMCCGLDNQQIIGLMT